MKFLVGIPCYNCAPQIQRVITKLKARPDISLADFFIVDNCSTDDSCRVIKQEIAGLSNFRLIRHKQNYGLGGSFKSIYQAAREGAYDYLVLFHGDDQATAEDLFKMIRLATAEGPDCIFGSRFMKGSKLVGYSGVREWGNRLINLIFSKLLGREISEIGSGLNIYRMKTLPSKEIQFYPNHLAFDLNLLFHYTTRPYRTLFMPIEWHEKDQRSNASNIRVGVQVVSMLLKHKAGKKNLEFREVHRDYEVL